MDLISAHMCCKYMEQHICIFFEGLFILITRGQSQQPQTLTLYQFLFKTATKKKKKNINKHYKIQP